MRGVNAVNLEALPLVSNAAGWKSMFGLIQDPQLIMIQSQMAMYDPDTQ